MKQDDALKPTLKKMGLKLKQLRQKKGYSSYETFAYDFDFSRMQYWRIEKGETNLTIKTLLKLLSIHKISLEEFFKQIAREGKK